MSSSAEGYKKNIETILLKMKGKRKEKQDAYFH